MVHSDRIVTVTSRKRGVTMWAYARPPRRARNDNRDGPKHGILLVARPRPVFTAHPLFQPSRVRCIDPSSRRARKNLI